MEYPNSKARRMFALFDKLARLEILAAIMACSTVDKYLTNQRWLDSNLRSCRQLALHLPSGTVRVKTPQPLITVSFFLYQAIQTTVINYLPNRFTKVIYLAQRLKLGGQDFCWQTDEHEEAKRKWHYHHVISAKLPSGR